MVGITLIVLFTTNTISAIFQFFGDLKKMIDPTLPHRAEPRLLVVAPSSFFPLCALTKFNAFQFICGVEKNTHYTRTRVGFPTPFLFFFTALTQWSIFKTLIWKREKSLFEAMKQFLTLSLIWKLHTFHLWMFRRVLIFLQFQTIFGHFMMTLKFV